MVLKLLNEDLKEHCMQLCRDIIDHLQTEPNLLCRVITGDGIGIFLIRPGNEVPKSSVEVSDIAEAKESNTVMLIPFFHVKEIVHSQFLPQSQTINQQTFKKILWLMFYSGCEKRVEAGQIVAASPQQCIYSKRLEHLAIPGREEYH